MLRILYPILFVVTLLSVNFMCAQNLGSGYSLNDTSLRPMQSAAKPTYLQSFSDPSFPATTIRRISDAAVGTVRVPMYSTIQSWNADESLMIIYGNGSHYLLDGATYAPIRVMNDINPDDVETLFWDFNNADILYYIDDTNSELISYNARTLAKTTLVNLSNITSCSGTITSGNDVQMMSWDSDVITFRCGNNAAYYYRISTASLVQFNITNINSTAPMPFPSGNLFFHRNKVYDAAGNYVRDLNVSNVEHSCLGKLSNGNDAYYAVAFASGPNGGCVATLVVHDATTGSCYDATPIANYTYTQSGTHISALAHKNSQDGWVAVSCMGYDLDGQDILDQELFIAQAGPTSASVYRVAHHRSDEVEFDYWGEPHVTISPSGTRLLFGSDWSGVDDGAQVDAYVAELNSYTLSNTTEFKKQISIYPNPSSAYINVAGINDDYKYQILDVSGRVILNGAITISNPIYIAEFPTGVYFLKLESNQQEEIVSFIKN
ncbi:MAG: T9SS type A sorting domain-containing protein [Nonlabens sp.]|uniref:T9SS type A sorting domain-containing protein n=1 Tax=Nonlabens sp. TaxID=1888209 RepID=UPI003EF233C4